MMDEGKNSKEVAATSDMITQPVKREASESRGASMFIGLQVGLILGIILGIFAFNNLTAGICTGMAAGMITGALIMSKK